MVAFKKLLFYLDISVGDRSPNFKEIEMGYVIVFLLADIFLSKVCGQLGGDEFQVLLALAV